MSHVSIAMTLKQKPSLPSGWLLSLHVRRRRGQFGATSRTWWWFVCHEGALHHQHSAPCQTITKQYYIEVFPRLRNAVRRKWSQLWASGDWQLHRYNALAHSPALVQTFLCKISHHLGLSAPLQPRFHSLRLLARPKTTIAIEREEICECVGHSTQVQTTVPHCQLTSLTGEWLPTDAQ